jgi:hypothetical protein
MALSALKGDVTTHHLASRQYRSGQIGKFNAMFARDRKSMDRLNLTITEGTITIEQNYPSSRTIKSVDRHFATSNHDHLGNMDGDDRRLAFTRVSDRRQQDSRTASTSA